MDNLAIIPARGGSKRIPKKNIKDFLGNPIIAYSIKVALESHLFEEVMVSTDDQQIAEIAKQLGASIPFLRSAENASDFATTSDVLIEVIDRYGQMGKHFQYACCIYPTAPFISVGNLKKGFNILNKEKRDSVFPIVLFSHPIWRGLKIMDDGRVKMIWKENLNSRSQDLNEVYHDAGQWYWCSVESIKKRGVLFSDNSGYIVLDPLEVQDIDNLSDWRLAELKYEYLQSLKKANLHRK